MQVKFTYQFDNNGRTAASDDNAHIREMIEQVLFTSPGERVNRPDFGSGLLQLVFQPLSSELVTTTQYLVQGALNQWLGEIIEVNDVEVVREDSLLQVTVAYTVLRTRESQIAQFTR
jgi:phage baseplate assembly protein W